MEEKLEPRIKCKFCQEMFALFGDLKLHQCVNKPPDYTQWKAWLEDQALKLASFEEVVREEKGNLTFDEAFDILQGD